MSSRCWRYGDIVLALQAGGERGKSVAAARHQQQVVTALGHQMRQLEANAIAGAGDEGHTLGIGLRAHSARSQTWVR